MNRKSLSKSQKQRNCLLLRTNKHKSPKDNKISKTGDRKQLCGPAASSVMPKIEIHTHKAEVINPTALPVPSCESSTWPTAFNVSKAELHMFATPKDRPV